MENGGSLRIKAGSDTVREKPRNVLGVLNQPISFGIDKLANSALVCFPEILIGSFPGLERLGHSAAVATGKHVRLGYRRFVATLKIVTQ
ncbi:MAG TPA: hypothetical protein VHD36_20460 [Pirellulales bacterium]|nr:hypothetical protein [Pirellulales bacterium]